MTREREDAIYLLSNLIGKYGSPYDEALEMAINTLTKPDTFDIDDEMITKRQAIDALDKRFDNIPMEQTAEILMLRRDLRELPTVQHVWRWVPVSERLPEENGMYLVTIKNLTGYTLLDEEVFECQFYHGDWSFKGWEDNDVIAWMPMPEHYKGE